MSKKNTNRREHDDEKRSKRIHAVNNLIDNRTTYDSSGPIIPGPITIVDGENISGPDPSLKKEKR